MMQDIQVLLKDEMKPIRCYGTSFFKICCSEYLITLWFLTIQSIDRPHLKQRAWVGLYIKRVWTKWNLQRMSRNYKGAKGIFQVLCGGESWRRTQFVMRKPARTPQVPFLEPSGGAPCPALWLAKMTFVQLSHWLEMRSGPAWVLCNQTRSKSRHSGDQL